MALCVNTAIIWLGHLQKFPSLRKGWCFGGRCLVMVVGSHDVIFFLVSFLPVIDITGWDINFSDSFC
jgi:hypothetical protein